MATKLGWQKEREAKQKQKEWDAQQNFEHQDWQQKRHEMIKKKEAAELQAKESEEKAPEFLKKLGTMKEKAQNKPTKKADEGPTIEELDDGTDIPPWHRPNAPEKPEWVVLLLMAAEKEAQEEEMDDESVYVGGGSNTSLKLDYLPGNKDSGAAAEGDDQPEWMKQAKNLRSMSQLDSKSSNHRRSSSFSASEHQPKTQPWMTATLKASPKRLHPPGGMSASATVSPVTPLRPTIKKVGASKSASTDLMTSGEEKPEWMIGAEKLRSKKKDTTAASTDNADVAKPELTSSRSQTEPTQPEWMRQRSKIKQKAPVSPKKAAASTESTTVAAAGLPPQSPISKKEEPAQPEWMSQRSKIQQKAPLSPKKAPASPMKAPESSTDAATSASDEPPKSPKSPRSPKSPKNKKEPVQPEWMRQRSKIQQNKVPSSPRKVPASPKSTKDASDPQPAWMAQRAKIKQKQSSPEKPTTTTAGSPAKNDNIKTNDNIDNDDDDQPAFMKHVLKPRISIQELKESKVQEKLHNKGPVRQSSIRLTKEELTTNVVKEKLSQRTSLVDKKAQVKPEEMEWMKKKLKPRPSIAAGTTTDGESPNSSNPLKPTEKDSGDDGRPAWMKQRDKLKPRFTPEDFQTSIVQEKLHSKAPMRKSSIRLTKEELTTNKVQAKLHSKAPLRQSILGTISKKELESSPVKEKLAQRPSSLLDKTPPALAQEMKEARSSLKPSGSSRNLAPKPSSEETPDARPEWMKEAHRRMSSKRALNVADTSSSEAEAESPPVRKLSGNKDPPEQADGNDGTEAEKPPLRKLSGNKDPPEQADDKEPVDKRPEFMKEAQRRRSSRKVLSLSDNEVDEKEKSDPPKMRRSKTANEKYPAEKYPEKTKPWWMREAEKRLSAKGVIVDDKAREELKRQHKSGKDAVPEREIQKAAQKSDPKSETAAKEWEGVSPVDIMTPRTSDGSKVDKKSDKVATEWWKVGPPIKAKLGSSSIMDELDALSSDSKGSKPVGAQEDERFWTSLVSLGNEAFEVGSDSSDDSDDAAQKKPRKQPDFTASMNDISAVMRAETLPPRESILGSNSLLAKPPRESILGQNSILTTTSRSRSRSGSIGKRKKDKDKEKEKKPKKDKKKKDKKKEDKKEKKKKKEKKEEAKV